MGKFCRLIIDSEKIKKAKEEFFNELPQTTYIFNTRGDTLIYENKILVAISRKNGSYIQIYNRIINVHYINTDEVKT